MNITCECVDMRTSVSPHNNIRIELEGVLLTGEIDTKEVLKQLDWGVVFECLAEHGYTVTKQEHAA